MKTSLVVSLALGWALASPAAAAASEHAPKPHHRHAVAQRQLVRQSPAVDVRATAYALPMGLPLSLLSARPSSVQNLGDHETDGLSRNPDDCVKYGCVDNN